MKRHEFRSLGDGLRDVARSLGGRRFETQARIATVWADTVGSEIANHTHVEGIRSGQLCVAVDSATWATELTAMGSHLQERINEVLGQDAVRSMRFTVSREVDNDRQQEARDAETRRKYGDERVEPCPLDATEMERVEAMFADIRDDRLKTAALRAAVRDLEWKKGQKGAREA
jgi:hypothetical protein